MPIQNTEDIRRRAKDWVRSVMPSAGQQIVNDLLEALLEAEAAHEAIALADLEELRVIRDALSTVVNHREAWTRDGHDREVATKALDRLIALIQRVRERVS